MYHYETKSQLIKLTGGNIRIWSEIFKDPKYSNKFILARDVLNLNHTTVETKLSIEKLQKLYIDFKKITKINRVKKMKKTIKSRRITLLENTKN